MIFIKAEVFILYILQLSEHNDCRNDQNDGYGELQHHQNLSERKSAGIYL